MPVRPDKFTRRAPLPPSTGCPVHCLSLPSLVAEGGDDAAAGCVALVGEALRSGGRFRDSRAHRRTLRAWHAQGAASPGAPLASLHRTCHVCSAPACLPACRLICLLAWRTRRLLVSARSPWHHASARMCTAGAPAGTRPASSTCRASKPGPSPRCVAASRLPAPGLQMPCACIVNHEQEVNARKQGAKANHVPGRLPQRLSHAPARFVPPPTHLPTLPTCRRMYSQRRRQAMTLMAP